MMQLFGKELRQLLPFAGLWLCLAAMFYGTELATLRIDEQSYLGWCGDYCDIGVSVDVAVFSILFYMIAAYSLFPREFDDSTIDFLRSLPMARSTVFVAKVLSTCFLLCLLLLIEHVIETLLLLSNGQTLTGKNYWQIDATIFLRGCLFAIVIVAHGVFISWFRTVGLLVYCIYLVVLVWIEAATGSSAVFSIFEFFNNEYEGQRLLIDWEVVGFHLAVAAVLYVISYFLWTKTDSKPKAPGATLTSRILPIVVTVFGFFLVAGWMTTLVQTQDGVLSSDQINVVSTEHYNFVHALEDSAVMDELVTFAEDDYESLREILVAESAPVIQVDMTSENDHALGLASWKKIKMIAGSVDEVDPLIRRVLSHETAHVFQSVESDRHLSKLNNTVGFFIEGMAQYTSFNIVPDKEARDSNWLVSSISWKRQNITFDELANRAAFEANYDPEMLYGIGDIWVAAMADVCGEQSIGEFLRATAREGAPPNLAGTTFWRLTLQHIGCELEQVNDRWRQLMQIVVDNRNGQGGFPGFTDVAISRAAGSNVIRISARLEPEENSELPSSFYIRVKSEAKLAAAVSPVIRGRVSSDETGDRVEFSISAQLFNGQRFSYQLGYTPLPGSRNFYDRWRTGSLPR